MSRIRIQRDASNFYIASANGDVAALKVILKNTKFRDFWINQIEPASGLTALMLAAYNGKYDAVKLLLEYGADANIKGSDGSTALELTSKIKHRNIYKLLEAMVKTEEDEYE